MERFDNINTVVWKATDVDITREKFDEYLQLAQTEEDLDEEIQELIIEKLQEVGLDTDGIVLSFDSSAFHL